ncbi:hypothetical protein X777_05800 [Ooceraea biroi]|uniref:Uncharacterized protein n=1 Tax=Ooceraea biroi TaxID=2015173 RepID=A0A026WD17_OOCBI|nr:hypothetical protein X777_05800 [Ooceraea biroi]
MKCLVIVLIAMLAVNAVTAASDKCKPWLGLCHLTDDCCRNLVCLTYLAKCIPGKISNDDRPIGDGPFPPGYPN